MRKIGIILRLALSGLVILLISQAALAAELDGKWNFTIYSAEGQHLREIVLTQNGSAVSGKHGEEALTGSYKAGTLELQGEHYAEEAGYKALLKLTGKLEGGKLKGTGLWDTYNLTFEAAKAE